MKNELIYQTVITFESCYDEFVKYEGHDKQKAIETAKDEQWVLRHEIEKPIIEVREYRNGSGRAWDELDSDEQCDILSEYNLIEF